jgi:hypothetical protein
MGARGSSGEELELPYLTEPADAFFIASRSRIIYNCASCRQRAGGITHYELIQLTGWNI